jgi:hypothetical protein
MQVLCVGRFTAFDKEPSFRNAKLSLGQIAQFDRFIVKAVDPLYVVNFNQNINYRFGSDGWCGSTTNVMDGYNLLVENSSNSLSFCFEQLWPVCIM